MEILSQKQPNFFVESVGRYNQRSVQEYLVDSSTPKTNLFSINWKDGPFIDDVAQSDIGDCWLIASIQSLLETGKGGKENIKRIFKYIVNEKVNGEEKPKWVVLRLYPIKLYVEYRDDITAFKIISVPNPKPVDIHINIQEDNIIKELGQGRYEFKGAGEWVKYIEMAFKKFYRDKYITFVGDGWDDEENGANYIYRHLNDALMNKMKGEQTGESLHYGYSLIGQSVLSGKKMESTWMDVAMGYGENHEKATPKTETTVIKNKTKIKSTTKKEMTLLERKKNIIATLNKLKRYAYCTTIPNGDYEVPYYIWDGTDSKTDKKQNRQELCDLTVEHGLETEDTENEEIKKWNKLLTQGRESGKNTKPRPTAFLRTANGSSHVMKLNAMACSKPPWEPLAVEDTNNISLIFTNTNGWEKHLKGFNGMLDKILARDPTFTIVAEGGEKAKNHSVEKSKKRSYNRLVGLTNEWDGSTRKRNKIKNNEKFTLSNENFSKKRNKSTPKAKNPYNTKKK